MLVFPTQPRAKRDGIVEKSRSQKRIRGRERTSQVGIEDREKRMDSSDVQDLVAEVHKLLSIHRLREQVCKHVGGGGMNDVDSSQLMFLSEEEELIVYVESSL